MVQDDWSNGFDENVMKTLPKEMPYIQVARGIVGAYLCTHSYKALLDAKCRYPEEYQDILNHVRTFFSMHSRRTRK